MRWHVAMRKRRTKIMQVSAGIAVARTLTDRERERFALPSGYDRLSWPDRRGVQACRRTSSRFVVRPTRGRSWRHMDHLVRRRARSTGSDLQSALKAPRRAHVTVDRR